MRINQAKQSGEWKTPHPDNWLITSHHFWFISAFTSTSFQPCGCSLRACLQTARLLIRMRRVSRCSANSWTRVGFQTDERSAASAGTSSSLLLFPNEAKIHLRPSVQNKLLTLFFNFEQRFHQLSLLGVKLQQGRRVCFFRLPSTLIQLSSNTLLQPDALNTAVSKLHAVKGQDASKSHFLQIHKDSNPSQRIHELKSWLTKTLIIYNKQ